MLKLKCTRHPRYNGQSSPRASCEQCVTLHTLRLMALNRRLTIVETTKPTTTTTEEPHAPRR